MAAQKLAISNQTVSKHFGYSSQILSDWSRSNKIEYNRRYKALTKAYTEFLNNGGVVDDFEVVQNKAKKEKGFTNCADCKFCIMKLMNPMCSVSGKKTTLDSGCDRGEK